MLRNLLNRLAHLGGRRPARVTDAPQPAEQVADRLIAQGSRAEEAGRPADACEQYRKAIAAAPHYAKAHLNLGIGLEACGDRPAAIAAFEAALAIDPAEPYARYNLGRLLLMRGLPAQAEAHLRAALGRRPEFPEALIILSSVLDAKGEPAAAAAAIESALRLRPDDFGAWYHYGMLLKKLDRASEAESALRRACAAEPEDVDANYQLAIVLQADGALPEAEQRLRHVLAHKPAFADARAVLFDVLQAEGRLDAALTELETLLRQQPDRTDALYNHGVLLMTLGYLGQAETEFRRVLALDQSNVLAYRMLGSVLHRLGCISELVELCRIGQKCLPERFDLESFELFALNFSEAIPDDALFARHRRFGERLERAVPPRAESFANVKDPRRRLRIGYVSGDFNCHPVALFLHPLLVHHDRSGYEVYCYSTGGTVDDFTRKLSLCAEVWRPVAALSDAELAAMIARDGIDILLDLSGHSGISRLGAFALQPAPVQVAWLGYLNTTGMTRIRYRISDWHSDPQGSAERRHTEQLVRLPHSQWCYRPFVSIEAALEPPCRRNGFITFGSFNQMAKLSSSVRRLWAEILAQVPASRLLALGVPDGASSRQLLRDLTCGGVASHRITLLPQLPLADYYRAFDRVDIALDTTPYSGGTTTCDTLWMGVPVVTLAGSRSTSRSATSVLVTLGLSDWVAATPDEYLGLAVHLAADCGELLRLRQSLRQRLRSSPLMDEIGFARDMEQALRQMWCAWCASAAAPWRGS